MDEHANISQLEPKRVEILYEQSIPSITASIFTTFIVAYVLWDQVEAGRLHIWIGCFLLISGFRYYLVYRYHNSNTKNTKYELWLHLYIVSTVISGLMWGLSGYVVISANNILYPGFLLMCIGGLIAGSISSYSVFHSVFYAFSLPAILLYAMFLYKMDFAEYDAMIFLSFFFSCFMFIIESRTHKIINQSIALQFNNTSLLDYVDELKKRTELFQDRITKEAKTNADLEDELRLAKASLKELDK
jgi:hypothetical protein